MSSEGGRHQRSRHAQPPPVGRRRVLQISLGLGVVIAGSAELADRLLRTTPSRAAHAGARPPGTAPKAPASASGPRPASPSASRPSTAALPLSGKVVVIDPGHNPNNPVHVAQINSLVNAGGFLKACDTVGTQTDAGYPEFDFTLDVARRARAILRAAGARVILTQNGHMPYGPCVNRRAWVGNQARAHAVVAIHADGGPPDGYGFAVLIPELVQNASADNSMIIKPSRRLADVMLSHFGSATGQPLSTYLGAGGIQPRNDLAGLNLSTVPKVFIECANMRNGQDAAKVTDARWRDAAAHGIAASLAAFVTA